MAFPSNFPPLPSTLISLLKASIGSTPATPSSLGSSRSSTPQTPSFISLPEEYADLEKAFDSAMQNASPKLFQELQLLPFSKVEQACLITADVYQKATESFQSTTNCVLDPKKIGMTCERILTLPLFSESYIWYLALLKPNESPSSISNPGKCLHDSCSSLLESFQNSLLSEEKKEEFSSILEKEVKNKNQELSNRLKDKINKKASNNTNEIKTTPKEAQAKLEFDQQLQNLIPLLVLLKDVTSQFHENSNLKHFCKLNRNYKLDGFSFKTLSEISILLLSTTYQSKIMEDVKGSLKESFESLEKLIRTIEKKKSQCNLIAFAEKAHSFYLAFLKMTEEENDPKASVGSLFFGYGVQMIFKIITRTEDLIKANTPSYIPISNRIHLAFLGLTSILRRQKPEREAIYTLSLNSLEEAILASCPTFKESSKKGSTPSISELMADKPSLEKNECEFQNQAKSIFESFQTIQSEALSDEELISVFNDILQFKNDIYFLETVYSLISPKKASYYKSLSNEISSFIPNFLVPKAKSEPASVSPEPEEIRVSPEPEEDRASPEPLKVFSSLSISSRNEEAKTAEPKRVKKVAPPPWEVGQTSLNPQKANKLKDLLKILNILGFELIRTRGSHRIYRKPKSDLILCLAYHSETDQVLPGQFKDIEMTYAQLEGMLSDSQKNRIARYLK